MTGSYRALPVAPSTATATRAGAAFFLAGGAVLAHLPPDVGIPCPLRSATGIPCPFCGMTTSVRGVLGGHLSSIGANPLSIVFVVAAIALVLRPGLLRAVPTRIGTTPLLVVGAVSVGAAWLFELFRFGVF